MPSRNPIPRIPNMCPPARLTTRQPYSGPKYFIEKASHRRPGAAVGLRAVERGAQHRTISCRIGETVQRVAVTDDLPVPDASRAHLVFEGLDLFRWRERIVGAGADQHAGLHLAGNRGRPGCKDTVEADDGFEIGAVARKLQHHRAAEAEADGGHSVRIDLRQRGERRQRRTATRAKCFRLVAEVADQFGYLLQIARLPALAKHARPRHHEIPEAQSLVKHQHARPPLGCFLIEGEITAQIDRFVAVIDVVRLHRPSPSLPGTAEPELHIGLITAQPGFGTSAVAGCFSTAPFRDRDSYAYYYGGGTDDDYYAQYYGDRPVSRRTTCGLQPGATYLGPDGRWYPC